MAPIAKRYDQLSTITFQGKTRLSWMFGSAVEIETGTFLTAAHVIYNDVPVPPNGDMTPSQPFKAGIDATLIDDGAANPTRDIQGGTGIDLTKTKNLRNWDPSRSAVQSDLATVAAISSSTQPKDISGVAVFLKPTLSTEKSYIQQVHFRGYPDDSVNLTRALGDDKAANLIDVAASGSASENTILIDRTSSVGESGGPAWFNYGQSSESFVTGVVTSHSQTSSVISTINYNDFKTIFDSSSVASDFANNELKGRNLIVGSDDADDFAGSYRRDWLIGGKGNDTIHGTIGSDEIDGGAGSDLIDYRGLKSPDNLAVGVKKMSVKNELAGGRVQSVTTISKTPQGNPNGTLGVDRVYGVESLRNQTGSLQKLAGVDNITVERQFADLSDVGTLNLYLDDNVARILISDGDKSTKQSGYVDFRFSSSTITGASPVTQEFNVDLSSSAIVSNSNGIWINNKQLVGGATFDFDKFDRFGGKISGIFDIGQLGFGTTLNRLNAYLTALTSKDTQYLAGINAPLGTPTASLGSSLAIGFAPLLFGDLINVRDSWSDWYHQEIIGTQGEHYTKAKTGVDAAGQDVFDLTITMNPTSTDGQPYSFVLHGWQDGDFGIHLVETGWRNGLETGLNQNGQFDNWQGVDLAKIRAQLASVGLFTNDSDTPAVAAMAARTAVAAAVADTPENVVRHGNSDANVLGGGDGADLLRGDRGDDQLLGGAGRDVYVFAVGDGSDVIDDVSPGGNVLRFLNGLDVSTLTKTLVAGDNGEQDLLVTYGGTSTIRIKHWSTLSATDQATWSFESASGSFVGNDATQTPDLSVAPVSAGGVLKTVVTGTDGDDTLSGTDAPESVDGAGGNDLITGGAGDDELHGGDGNDRLEGGDGNDRILDGAGDDTIAGGKGDDVIELDYNFNPFDLFGTPGDTGKDVVLFNLGDGKDQINLPFNQDTLRFGAGISPKDILIDRPTDFNGLEGDVRLRIVGTTDEVRLNNHVKVLGGYAYQPESVGPARIEFADGTVWTREDLHQAYLKQAVTSGDDNVLAFSSDDRLAGGLGNDVLAGLGGSDTYVWNRGDGNDTIVEIGTVAGLDRLVLGAGISVSDISIGLSRLNGGPGGDLILTVGGTGGGSVTLSRYAYGDGVERVVFADGTVWSRADLSARLVASQITDGNDNVNGTWEDDTVSPGAGNDTLAAGTGRDTIDGGAGNDDITGADADDVIRFGAAFGQDTVEPHANKGKIEFTTYNLSDFTVAYAPYTQTEYAKLTLTRNGSTDQLTILDFHAENGAVDSIRFADGSTLSNAELGVLAAKTAAATNLINGTTAAETLSGTTGNDRILAGDGADSVAGGNGDDVVLGGGGNDTLRGEAGLDALYGDAGDDRLEGGADADSLAGGVGNDTLLGGVGDDTLVGGAGNDTYVFNRGDGRDLIVAATQRTAGEIDTLSLTGGITAAELRYALGGGNYSRPAKDLIITFANAPGDQITITDFLGLGAFTQLSIGSTTITGAQILETVFGATSGADTITTPTPTTGGSNRSFVYGGRGNDTLSNSATTSNDTFVFVRGDGQDRISDYRFFMDYSNDTLQLIGYKPSEVLLTRTGTSGSDLTVTFTSGGDRIDITNHFGNPSRSAMDAILFDDGTVWSEADIRAQVLSLAPTSGADTITDFDGADLIRGGAGNDLLNGSGGNDRFQYNAGDGQDTITDSSGDGDRLELGAGLKADTVDVRRSSTDANDAVLNFSASDVLTLKGVFTDATAGIDQITFADGTVWSHAALAQKMVAGLTTTGNDTITGTVFTETLVGGTGNDILTGGAGDDAYLFNRGDGQDVIVEGAGTDVDRVLLGTGITPATATLRKSAADANDLVIDLGSGDTITVKGQFSSAVGAGIELIVFADGTTWGRTLVDQKIAGLAQTTGSDSIVGSSGADQLSGGTGNDTLDGRGGADSYLFNRGDGQDVIADSGTETGQDRIVFGAGIAAKDLDLTHSGNDLVIAIRGSTDAITVKDHFAAGGPKIGTVQLADGTLWRTVDLQRLADNRAPTVVTTLTAKSVAQNAAFSYAVPAGTFTDADAGDALTLTATRADGSALPTWLKFDGTTFTGTPGNADVGTINVKLTATDKVGDLVSQSFALNVTNVNDAPVATQVIGNQALAVGSTFSYQLPATLFSDPDNGLPGVASQTITLSAKLGSGAALPTWLTFNPSTRTFSGTPTSANQGALDIVISASDGTAVGTTRLGLFVGTSGNTAPTVGTAIASQSAPEDATWSFQIPANAFSDTTTGDRLRYSATLASGAALPAWLSLDPIMGLFKGMPANGDVGALSIKVTATDIFGAAASSTFALAVTNTNDAPVASGNLDSFAVTEDSPFSYAIPAGLFSDVDAGDVPTLSAKLADGSALPSWLNFDAAQGKFSGTPREADIGPLSVVVRATDKAGASIERSMFLLVNGVNDAPQVLKSIPSFTTRAQQSFSYTIPAGTFVDPDSVGLSLSVRMADGSVLPIFYKFDPLTWTLTGSSPQIDDDAESVTTRFLVTAMDRDGAQITTPLDLVFTTSVSGNYIAGTSGNDTLYGTYGHDTIDAGAGNDQLYGWVGVDRYLFGRGDGQDTIVYKDPTYDLWKTNSDIVVFKPGVSPDDVEVLRSGWEYPWNYSISEYKNDLLLRIRGTSDQILIQDQFSDHSGSRPPVKSVEFADGTVWSASDILARLMAPTAGADTLAGADSNDLVKGGAGDDVLYGSAGDDTLDGESGNDNLYGGTGNDTYVFGRGSGSDIVLDAYNADASYGFDVLKIGAGVALSDLVMTRDRRTPNLNGDPNAGSLLIQIAGTTDSIRIYAQNDLAGGRSRGIERIDFADGSSLSLAQIMSLTEPSTTIQGTDAADTLTGSTADEILVGGKGADFLAGGEGSDVYVWNQGDGNDTIVENDVSSYNILKLGAGINPSDLKLTNVVGTGTYAYDLYIKYAPDNAMITVVNQFFPNQYYDDLDPVLGEIQFANGTIWDRSAIIAQIFKSTSGNDRIVGFNARADILDGGLGNDTLIGASGENVYVFNRGYGQDVFTDEGYETSTARLGTGIAPSEIVATQSGSNLVLTFTGQASDRITLTNQLNQFGDGVDEIAFADGTLWKTAMLVDRMLSGTSGNDVIRGDGRDNELQGGAGNDALYGQGGNDRLIGGAGNDTLTGSTATSSTHNTYTFMQGFGADVVMTFSANDDTLEFSSAVFTDTAAVRAAASEVGGDVVISANANDKVTIKNFSLSLLNSTPINIIGTALAGWDRFETSEGTALTIDPATLLANDVGSGALTFVGLGSADGGQVALNAQGKVVFTPKAGFWGESHFTYIARDAAGSTSTGSVTVHVIGHNDAPVMSELTLVAPFQPENLTGSRIATFTATDPEQVLRASANFAVSDPRFEVVAAENGAWVLKLRTGQALNREVDGANFAVTVATIDPAGAQVSRSVTIPVANVNEAPTGISVVGGTVVDTAAAGTVVATLTAVDPDSGDSHSFAIAGAGSSLFELVGNQIVVKSGAHLDGTGAPRQDLQIVVTDAGGLTVTTTVTVQVQSPGVTVVGTSEADTLRGSTGADLLRGLEGDDKLVGGAGADTLDGGAGLDTADYSEATAAVGVDRTDPSKGLGDALGDTFTGVERFVLSAYADTFVGSSDAEEVVGGDGADLIYGGDGADTLSGGLGADSLRGGLGDDRLEGGAGADDMDGGGGLDVLVYANSDAAVQVNLATGAAVGGHAAGDTFRAVAGIEGSAFGDTLTGDASANMLRGLAGNDTLDGSAGADTLQGGLGDDTYVVDNTGDVVTENAGEGTDLVRTALTSYALTANVENLTYTGSGAFAGTGNALANTLTGGAGADTLDGGAGNDTLVGGAGNDVYLVDATGDVVTEAASAGTDEVRTTLSSYTLGSNVENLTYKGLGAFAGTGNTLANLLVGGTGSDTLDGGTGADTLQGGLGDDTYVVDNAGDVVTEAASAGVDQVRTSLTSYTLGANLENLTFTGTAASTGTGNTLDNVLTGGSGADTLSGGAGNDTLDGAGGADSLVGGAGNDTYVIDNTGDVVTENASEGTDLVRTALSAYTLGTNLENLTFTGAGAFVGTGNTLANLLVGGAGNDTLDGGAGADTLQGGLGDDIYVVDNVGDVVTEAASAGADLVRTALASYTLGANLEKLTYTGASTTAFTGTGNELANVLIGGGAADSLVGGAGNDTLDGGAGADTLKGGVGDDTYVVDNTGDVVTENANEGIDLVQSAVTFTLGTNVENLTLTGTGAINATGNDLANLLTGNAGANVLSGGLGADTMRGGAGNDTYVVDNVGDVVTENASEGTDLVQSAVSYALGANVENLTLTGTGVINATGNELANTLVGNGVANVLDGGLGNDTLTGGAGKDAFNFTTALNASTNLDQITDFTVADDVIQIKKSVFAGVATASGVLAASEFKVGTAAADADDHIIYNSSTGALLYDADGTGATAAVQFAKLSTGLSLTNTNFKVI